MQERWVDVEGEGGVRLVVRDVAAAKPDAPNLLLHHGLASSQRIWDLMLPRLARRFRVVTFDARGHGRSSKPRSRFGFDPVIGDALAVIRARRLRRPVIVGHSWGAMVALELAARHPRSVAAAVLVDGGLVRMRAHFPDWATAKHDLAPPHLAGTPVDEFRAMIRTFMAGAVDVTPEIEDIVLSVMRVDGEDRIRPNLSRANHFRILRAIWEQDPGPLLAALRVPALAVVAHAVGDPAFDAAKREAALRAKREGTRRLSVVWMEGIHDLPLQHPEALAARIERFARSALG